jgi:2-phospho-L-lactate guanylyltransferase (CobY/MobA/RfbA family)
MKDARLQAVWHALNEAQVQVVLAGDDLPRAARDRLMAALRQVRNAEVLLVDELTGGGDGSG